MAGGSVPSNLAGIFAAAGKQYGIPAAVLAGVSSVESNIFRNTGPSSAGAIGGMQFEPGTARGLGVNPNDPRSAIFGAAKYLTQLGYHSNPLRALGAYNGGPGNPQYGYANQVMAEARRLAGTFHGGSPSSFTVPGTPSIPQVPGTTGPTSFNLTSFDRSGFDQAQKAYVLGSFLKESEKGNPWGGPSSASALAPLFAAGKLSSTPPDQSQFFKTQTYRLAQSAMQGLAGTSSLSVHPTAKQGLDAQILAQGKGSPVSRAIVAADQIARNHYNYEWGGGHNAQFAPTHGTGHGSGVGTGFDCSGAISAILHAAGKLNTPMVAQQFMSYGQAGPGGPNDVTIYASPTHVFARIGGKFFGTSAENPGGGAGWFATASTGGFVVRHVSLAGT